MEKILIICASRGRPERVQKTINSWKETTSGLSDFLLMVDEDDEKLPGYQKIKGIIIRVNKTVRRGAVSLHNKAFKLFPNYQYYGVGLSDDYIFRTKNWDKIMVDEIKKSGDWGIVYGNDLFQEERLATFPIISANIIKIMGYISPPKLWHLTADQIWKDIGEGIGKLSYMGDIIIEHMHPSAGKAEWDEGYQAVNSPEVIKHDNKIYKEWKEKEYPQLIEKLRKAIYG